MEEEERLNRQLLIEGWNQEALNKAKIGIVGDDDLLASLYISSISFSEMEAFISSVVKPKISLTLVS